MNVGSIFELANRTGLWVFCGARAKMNRVQKFLYLQQRTNDGRGAGHRFGSLNHGSAAGLNISCRTLFGRYPPEADSLCSQWVLSVLTQLAHQWPKLGELDQASYDLNDATHSA